MTALADTRPTVQRHRFRTRRGTHTRFACSNAGRRRGRRVDAVDRPGRRPAHRPACVPHPAPGELDGEPDDVRDVWRLDLVSFLLGCSFTAEHALLAAGIPLRHVERGLNVAMFGTNRPCRRAGVFSGDLVVSMRPLPAALVDRAVEITGAMPAAHGAPVHVGDPAALGIENLDRPDYGDAVGVRPGEVPVFWACGVTPQNVLRTSRVEFAITHAPGHLFLTDRTVPLPG